MAVDVIVDATLIVGVHVHLNSTVVVIGAQGSIILVSIPTMRSSKLRPYP